MPRLTGLGLPAGRPALAFADRTGEPVEAWARRVRAVVRRLAGPPLPAGALPDGPAVPGAAAETEVLAGGRVRVAFGGGLSGTLVGAAAPGEATGQPPRAASAAVLICAGFDPAAPAVAEELATGLAQAGLPALVLDYGLPATEAARTALDNRYRLAGESLLGALVAQTAAALAWLAASPSVAGQPVGLVGIGAAAAVALHTALTRDVAPPLCLAGPLGTYPELFAAGYEPLTLPGILRYADLPDLLTACQPGALHLQCHPAGPEPDARAAATAVEEGYAAGGLTHRCEVRTLDGPGVSVAEAVNFLGRAVKAADQPAALVPPVRVHLEVAARRDILDRVDAALASGMLTQAREVERFERLAAPWVGGHAIAVNAGTGALEIALSLIGVAGRRVLVPVNTFFATAATALRLGASVGFVDLELTGLGMDPAALREALDREADVAAVVVVHIGGIVAPSIRTVLDECRARGVPVVEDAAHAFGARLDGAPAGTFGRLAAFSLYPTKVLTSAEGGILTGASGRELALARRLRDHGRTEYSAIRHDCLGGNWRLSELHASVGAAQLERFAGMHAARHRLAARYDAKLAGLPRLRRYELPASVETNYYKYLVYLDDGVDRADLKRRLRDRYGIVLSGEVYDAILCDQPYFAGGKPAGAEFADRYPNARWFAERHACLPLYPGLTEAEQDRVVAALRAELS